MIECECGRIFKSDAGYKCHKYKCSGEGTPRDMKRKEKNFICPECKKHIKSSIQKHINYCNGLGVRRNRLLVGHHAWNKGLTKETDSRIAEIGRSISAWQQTLSKDVRIKRASHSGTFSRGGLRVGGGRGKKGWYKGIWCDSSWELAWVIYQLDHNIPFKRNTEGFEYEYLGEKRKYYPDFILLNDSVYVEIKGYHNNRFSAKLSYFKHTIVVLDKISIKPYLDYVIDKYGFNFIELYEERKSKPKLVSASPGK